MAAVLAYNWLQERKAKREAERAFGARHADVLLDAAPERREPTLGPHAPPGQASPRTGIDYIIELASPSGIAGPVLRELWSPVQLRFARRAVMVQEGRDKARAALQLVSRDGVVSDAELLEFRSAVETLAAKLGAAVAAPEMREALEAARDLDRACAEADIQVALHVVGVRPDEALFPKGPFSVERRADGVTLSLDVPTTPEPRRAYEAMARAAVQLAAAGGGRVVDDNGTALDERSLAAIGAQVAAVGAVLAERDLEPGSPLALRLFS